MRGSRKKMVRVEMTAETLGRLLAAGQVCAADLRCLDCESKKCIWRLCLMNCMNGRGKRHFSTSPGNDCIAGRVSIPDTVAQRLSGLEPRSTC
jgi:hypothetical protein